MKDEDQIKKIETIKEDPDVSVKLSDGTPLNTHKPDLDEIDEKEDEGNEEDESE